MADTAENAGTGDGSSDKPDRDATTGMPRWVKISAIVVGILVLLAVIAKLTGLGGEHGPGRHAGASTPPASVTALQTNEHAT